MRKMVLGASMAASALFMSGENAGGQEADICDSVYDETLAGDSSVQLTRLIGEYATNGVEVHVQIVEEGSTLGFDSSEEIESASERLKKECGWQDPDILNIIVSLEPRAYDIYRTGQARQDISQAESDKAAEGLVDDLRDSSTSFQNDVANAIQRLNPYDSDDVPTNVPSASGGDQEDSEPRNIPVKNIGLGIAGGLAALGIGSRTFQGVRVSRVNRRAQKIVSGAQANLVENLTPAEAQLGVLPDDDATTLRQLVKEANQHLVNLSSSAESMRSAYHGERFRPWPSKRRLDELAEQIDSVTGQANETSSKTAAEFKDVETNIVRIDEIMAEFSFRLNQIAELFTRLTGEGWDLSSLEAERTEFASILSQAQELKEKHYIDKPVDLMNHAKLRLDSFYELVEKLPERRAAADALPDSQVAEIKKRQKTVQTSQQILADLKEGYSKSCYEDLTEHDDGLDEQMGSLTELNQKVSELVGVTSAEAVTQAEAAQQKFMTTCTDVDAAVSEIKTRADKLVQIKTGLPARLTEIEEEIETAIEFSQGYEDDIEEGTRDQVNELETAFKNFRRKDVDADKPSYLAIDEETTRFKEKASTLLEQARQEQAEMVDLRSDSEHLQAEAEDALNDLENYISSHSSDIDSSTESKARGLEVASANTSLSRAGLRDQVKDYKKLIEDIRSAKDEAKRDVQREEDERRRREQEQARRSSSSIGSGSFGSWGGGSKSGGGHSSGNW